MVKYAFVSYSHKNKFIVSDFVEDIRQRNVNVWFDGDIEYGSDWDSLIMDRLINCSVVFLFISKEFAVSRYCSKEFDIALDGKRNVIPILLDKENELPEEMRVKMHRIHHMSIYDHSSGFTYEDINRICQIEAVKEISTDTYCSSGSGPERPMYSYNDYIDHRVFNSVKDHPLYGDERNFLRAKLPGMDSFVPYGNIFVQPGKEYEFEMLIHNNADFDLNKIGTGIANDVRVAVKFPEMIRPSKIGEVVALIHSTTTVPAEIWDSIELCSDRPVFLKFKYGSAVFERIYDGKKRILPLDLFSREGTYITDFHREGKAEIPAGDDYVGRIRFVIRTNEDSARIEYVKTLSSLNGQPLDSVRIGEEFIVKTEFYHRGDIDLKNVTFREFFPDGMELIPSTTVLTNIPNPNGIKLKDIIDKNGINTGLYGPRTSCTIVYHAKFTGGTGLRKIIGSVTHHGAIQQFNTSIQVVP